MYSAEVSVPLNLCVTQLHVRNASIVASQQNTGLWYIGFLY
jgi:hypothetical protein